MSIHGVGIDVADPSRLAGLLERRAESFVQRWFTDSELAEAGGGETRAAALSRRFAAKEAVWKALGLPGGSPVPWRCIQVLGADGGNARVELTGWVAADASRLGVTRVTVAITGSSELVTAVAIAEDEGG